MPFLSKSIIFSYRSMNAVVAFIELRGRNKIKLITKILNLRNFSGSLSTKFNKNPGLSSQ